MARELPFKDLEKMLYSQKNALQRVMTDQYMWAKANRRESGSEEVQQLIYDKFCEVVTDKDLEIFGNTFQIAMIQRDKALRNYVLNSVDHLDGIKGNEGLVQAQFLESKVKDVKTNLLAPRIVPVTGYYNEKNIADMVQNRYEGFFPELIRPDGSRAPRNQIEIMSVSNITGLYDPSRIKNTPNFDFLDILAYAIYSRVKNSEREMHKLLDWYAILRNDYPYDTNAERIVFYDDKRKCGNTGEQMYEFRDFTNKEYKKYGPIMLKNVKTKEENAKSLIKKLHAKEYDQANFREVLTQMKRIYNTLEKKSKGNTPVEITFDQRQGLLQYLSIMHFFNDDRVELQLMNGEMQSHFEGKYIGYTTAFVHGRDDYREKYLRNPSISPARIKEQKREERTVRNKNRGSTKDKYFEQAYGELNTNTQSPPEPSVRFLMWLLEERYKKVLLRSA